jgi:hypothetical protein
MKLIFLAIIFALSFIPCLAQPKTTPVKITGEVVAYIKPISVRHKGHYPNKDTLIVKVKRSKRAKAEYIKVIT